jgi:diguanylate cyclase
MKNLLQYPLPSTLGHQETEADDWGQLLCAVSARLRQAAGAATPGSGAAGASRRGKPAVNLGGRGLRHIAVACATALEQLQDEVVAAERRHLRLQQQLEEVRTELALALERERQATNLALHDGLTELPNRRYLSARLHDELREPNTTVAGLVLLFIDLDGFKHVNDTHGHMMGDALLRVVAARLRHAVRSEDLVCRLGGDEFVLMLPSRLSQEQLTRLATQLLDTVTAPIQLGSAQVVIRPSIGIAVFPGDGHTPQALLHSADSAMYRAKQGHSGFAFHNVHNAQALS